MLNNCRIKNIKLVGVIAASLMFFLHFHSTQAIGQLPSNPMPPLGVYNSQGPVFIFGNNNNYRSMGESITSGDLDNDGNPEIIFGPIDNGDVLISKPYEAEPVHNQVFVGNFYPELGAITNFGISVAAGDISGDERDEIVVAPRRGGKGKVVVYSFEYVKSNYKVWNSETNQYGEGQEFQEQKVSEGFYPYGESYSDGLIVATVDVDGDGKKEIALTKATGQKSNISVFEVDGTKLVDFSPYEDGFLGGVSVAGVDYNNDGKEEIITAPIRNKYADVKVFNSLSGELIKTFRIGNFTGGATLSARLENGTPYILVSQGPGGNKIQQYNLFNEQQEGVNIQPTTIAWKAGYSAVYFGNSSDFYVMPGSQSYTNTELIMAARTQPTNPKTSTKLNNPPISGIFDGSSKRLQSLPRIAIGSSIFSIDIDNDNEDEIIVGSPQGVKNRVWLYEQNGQLIRSFSVLDKNAKQGILVQATTNPQNNNIIIFAASVSGVSRIVQYNTLGQALTTSMYPYGSSFKNAIALSVGDVTGDGLPEIVAIPRTTNPTVRYFTLQGEKLGQFTIRNYKSSNNQVLITDDYDNDGAKDILVLPGTKMNEGFTNDMYDVYSTRTNQKIILDKTRSTLGDPWISYPTIQASWGFYFGKTFPQTVTEGDGVFRGALPPNSSSNLSTFSTYRDSSGQRIIVGAPGPYGAWALVTGEHDPKIITPYSSTWKGGVTVVAIKSSSQYGNKFLAVPGRIYDDPNFAKAADFSQPSILPKGVNYQYKTYSGKLPSGSYFTAYVVIANLHNPKLVVKSTSSNCGVKGNPCTLANYVKQEKGFAGINGDIGNSVRSAFTATPIPLLTFSSKNEWIVDVPTDNFKANANGKSIFSGQTNTTYTARVTPYYGGCCLGVMIGVSGGDIFLINYSLSKADVTATDELRKRFNLFGFVQQDGGGTAQLYYQNRYITGPGRRLGTALILKEK